MPSGVDHLREMARQCRQLAEAVTDPGARLQLLITAEQFERLALLPQIPESACRAHPRFDGSAEVQSP